MFLPTKIYCGKCKSCVGFVNGIQTTYPTIYCLDCEAAIREDERKRDEYIQQYRSAAARAFIDVRK